MRNPLISLILLTAMPGIASHAADVRDHDRARNAVATGQQLSLSTILSRIEQSHPGRILEIERDRFKGREIYEIEVLGSDGRVIELSVDAATGAILDSEYED